MRTPRGALVAATLAVVARLAMAAGAQQPAPVFRGGVRTVPIYATVTDGVGGMAIDLRKDDFEVRDNGALQTITQFTTAQQPINAILLLDGSGSMLPVFNAVVDAANAFVIRMAPADQVRVGSFADVVQFSPGFTSDRDALLSYLHNQFNLRMANETKLWDAVHTAIAQLGGVPGRRVVFLFTDGYDTVSTATMTEILGEAIRREIEVYAVAMWTGQGVSRTRPNLALGRLTAETGGGFYELTETDEMNSVFTRIATELHLQYILGFAPKKLDGKIHKLEVKVKPRNMRVRARTSYLAAPEGRS